MEEDPSPGNARRIVKLMVDEGPQFIVPLALCSCVAIVSSHALPRKKRAALRAVRSSVFSPARVSN